MSFLPGSPQTNGDPHPSGTARRRLGSRWLALARAGWIGVTGLCLALFVAAAPARFAQLHTPPAQVRLALSHLNLSVGFYATYNLVCEICLVAGFLSIAAVLFWWSWGKSNQWLVLFVALFLVAFGTDTPTIYALMTRGVDFAVLVKGIDVLAWASLGFFLSLFPDGRFVPGFTRWLAVLNVAYQVLWLFPDHSPLFPPNWPPLIFLPFQLSLLVCFLYAQIYRYFRVSGPVQRQQTKWVLFGLIAAGCTLPFLTGSISPSNTQPEVFGILGIPTLRVLWLFIPLSIGVAMVRYRLWDIDLIINRTLIYGILTVSVIGLYILVVGLLGTLLQAQGNIVIELVATGLVAVLFQPLRNALQRGINRLMFGERDDPYRVVSHLGQRLEATLAPGEVLPAIVETVARSLKLPSVAIRLKQDDTFTMVACYGLPREPLLRLPLIYQAETIGELVLAPRTARESFTSSERHLLKELARQAGIAVHTVLLTADLERSRQHIVAAREEARRRLGSDLHDGLGHTLAGLLRTVDTTAHLLERDPATAKLLLSDMKQHTKSAIEDVRRLAHSLHPPELELLGLLQALRERIQQYQQPGAGGLHVHMESPQTLPPLPIAVEAATYYIALEALHNIQRHAQAQHCHLRLGLVASDDTLNLLPGVWNASVLELEICDDGRGLPEEAQEKGMGLGFASMHERATELGGTCLIEHVTTGGTRVKVRLPCLQATDVILMDLKMPSINGIEATRRIHRTSPHIALLVITMFADDTSVFPAIRAGASGYLLKDADQAELVRAIQTVAAGGVIFSPGIARRVLHYLAEPPSNAPPQAFDELTPREREILELIAQGYRNAEIAEQLVLSPKTVSNHVSNVLLKLQAADRTQLMLLALEAGLGKPDKSRQSND